jgi:hypothetical protein
VLGVTAALATASALLVLDGLWAGGQMFRGVASARSDLAEGTVAVVTGDPGAARPFFQDASAAADAVVSAADHPAIQLMTRIPWIGDNVRAVEAVAVASQQTAAAGLAMADAADTLDWHDLLLPATGAIGSVDLPTLRSATPSIDEATRLLGVAAARLEAADTGRLVGPVRAGFDDALETLQRRARIAFDTRDFVRLMPAFLGAGSSRSYLMAVQTLGRPQGTGGRIDLVGTLRAERGTLSLESPLAPADDTFADANLSPDGPTSAQALLAAARDAGMGELDGVVLVDSVWLEDAVWVTGQVEVPGLARPLTPNGTADVLERDVFEGPSEEQDERLRADLANAIVDAYLERRPSTEAFAIGSAGSVADRHLMVYSTRPKEQEILTRLRAAGVFSPGPNPLAPTWRSLVENHAVVFTTRTVSHTVSIDPDGSARVRTVVVLSNGSPDGPPSVLVGHPLPATVEEPGGVDPVGGWAGELRVYLAPKAAHVTVETSIPSDTEVIRDDGRAAAVATLAADPGDSMTLIVSYTIEHAVTGSNGFRMVVTPQPTLDPGIVRVRIDAPGASTITAASDGVQRTGGTARWTGKPTAPFPLFVQW